MRQFDAECRGHELSGLKLRAVLARLLGLRASELCGGTRDGVVSGLPCPAMDLQLDTASR